MCHRKSVLSLFWKQLYPQADVLWFILWTTEKWFLARKVSLHAVFAKELIFGYFSDSCKINRSSVSASQIAFYCDDQEVETGQGIEMDDLFRKFIIARYRAEQTRLI